jgi:hypothetical protein
MFFTSSDGFAEGHNAAVRRASQDCPDIESARHPWGSRSLEIRTTAGARRCRAVSWSVVRRRGVRAPVWLCEIRL